MSEEIKAHIEAVEAHYRNLIIRPDSRLAGGARLWTQFQQAVAAWRVQQAPDRVAGIIERVNELAVAKGLLSDEAFADRTVQYEPTFLPDNRRIDFVVPLDDEAEYHEVKTIQPRAEDNDQNWEKYEARSELFTPDANYIVAKQWLGAEIFGNSFSARSSFMRYTREFEDKLAHAQQFRPGPGRLIFCGNGFDWHVSELEDFAEFYRTGRHRSDDPFGAMEDHHMKETGISLRRNIRAIGCLIRQHDAIKPARCINAFG
jgi:hypothetical protein